MAYSIRVRACALIIENNSVLLVEFQSSKKGLYYNLPAGGVDPGESIVEAVRREVKEETCADVEVGPVAFMYEYAPHHDTEGKYSSVPHTLSIIFDCKLLEVSVLGMPEIPDANQIGVKWIPLSELGAIKLYPDLAPQLIHYAQNRQRNIDLIEEC